MRAKVGSLKLSITGLGGVQLVTGLGLTPVSFPAAPSGPAFSARRRIGTRVRYSLGAPASVRFTVQHRSVGRVAHKHLCVKQTRSNRRHRRCTRYTTLPGSFTLVSVKGANSFPFRGRIGGKTLRPGTYRLVATPSVGAFKSRPTRISFRITH